MTSSFRRIFAARKLLFAATALAAAHGGQLALAQETTTDAEVKAAMDEETLRGSKLDNDKKEQDLAAAKRKEILDSIPTSPTSGKVEGKAGAGKMEANALAAASINAVADDIAADVRGAAVRRSAARPGTAGDICKLPAASSSGGGAGTGEAAPVLLLAGSGTLSFSHWEQFRFRACAIQKEFEDALGTRGPAAPADDDENSGSAAGVLTAVSAVSKLLQLLTPDWEVGGIEATATDKALLAAVANAYIGSRRGPSAGAVYWSGQVSKLGGGRAVFDKLAHLDAQDVKAAKRIAELQPALDKAKKNLAAAKGEAAKERAQAAVKALEKQIEPYSTARDHYSQLLKHLNGKEGEALLPINQVVNQAAAETLLGDDGVVLNLAIESTGGGYYSRKAIWDIIGVSRPPYWVSGGAVVNYLAVRPSDQRVVAAGLFSCSAGYVRISRAAAVANNGIDSGRCRPIVR